MNTTAITSSSKAPAATAYKTPSQDTTFSDVPFSQMLNREIADKRTQENAATNQSAETVRSASNTTKATSESADDSQPKDTTNTEQTNASTEQLLLIAAQFSQAATSAQTATATQVDTASNATDPTAQTGIPATVENTALTTSQIDVAQTKTPAASADKAEATTDFNAALRQAAEKNQAQDLGADNDKSISSQTTQPATKTTDTLALSAAADAAAKMSADKTSESRPDLSAALAPIQQAAASHAQTLSANASDKIAAQVGTPAWNHAIGQKVVWMIGSEQQSASLTLNPPDLGPLQVVLSVSSTQANASFYSSQAEVRQALEAALPKLREMLGDAGIQLGQTSVNAGSPQQQGSYAESPSTSRSVGQSVDVASPSALATTTVRIVRDGLIDTFA